MIRLDPFQLIRAIHFGPAPPLEDNLIAWGRDDLGQLNYPAGRFVALSARFHTNAAAGEGAQDNAGWGHGNAKFPPALPRLRRVAIAGAHSGVGIRADNGLLETWGDHISIGTSPSQGSGPWREFAGGFSEGRYIGLRADYTVQVFGSDAPGSPAGEFIAVSFGGGGNYLLINRADGTIYPHGAEIGGDPPPAGGGFVAVARGSDHGLALHSNGTVVGWGENDLGQASPPGGAFVQIAAGFKYSLGLRPDGTVVGWGKNDHGQASPPAVKMREIAAGYDHGAGILGTPDQAPAGVTVELSGAVTAEAQ